MKRRIQATSLWGEKFFDSSLPGGFSLIYEMISPRLIPAQPSAHMAEVYRLLSNAIPAFA